MERCQPAQEVAMTDKFKIGDIVQLKSGGPEMTVTGVYEDTILTTWFAESHEEKGAFPLDAIVIHQQEQTKS
jgi:uncharacterized protein YodC (DUF2158 family)